MANVLGASTRGGDVVEHCGDSGDGVDVNSPSLESVSAPTAGISKSGGARWSPCSTDLLVAAVRWGSSSIAMVSRIGKRLWRVRVMRKRSAPVASVIRRRCLPLVLMPHPWRWSIPSETSVDVASGM